MTISDECTTCHALLHDTSAYAFYVTPSNHPIKRKVQDVEAEMAEKKRKLLDSKRLVLVLDLDQTVLHAALLHGFDNDLENLAAFDPPQEHVYAFEMSGGSRMIVKFRPGLRDFLLQAHAMYEIHVYTMATQEYAKKIVELINTKILADVDPRLKQQIIGSRIITRSHTEDVFEGLLRQQGGEEYVRKLREKRKDIKHIVGDSSIAVILDDSDGVWADYLDHLVHCHPFLYWPNQDDLNKSFHLRRDMSAPAIPTRPAPSSSTSALQVNNILTQKKRSLSERNLASPEHFEDSIIDRIKRSKVADTDSLEDHKMQVDNPSNGIDSTTPDSNADKAGTDSSVANGIPSDAGSSYAPKPVQEQESDMTPTLERSSSAMDVDLASAAENEFQTKNASVAVIPNPSPSSPPDFDDSEPQKQSEGVSMDITEQNGTKTPKEEEPGEASVPTPSATPTPRIDVQIMPLLLPFGIRHLPEANHDRILEAMLRVLSDLHHHFFALHPESNRRRVQMILPRLRGQVFRGRRICLSGVVPRPTAATELNSRQWKEQTKVADRELMKVTLYGADLIEDITNGNPQNVTHLVSARGSTAKVKMASKIDSVFCVSKAWFDKSIALWKAQDEHAFQVAPDIPIIRGAPPSIPEYELWTREDIEKDIFLNHGDMIPPPSSPNSDSYIDLDSILQESHDNLSGSEEESWF